MKNTALIMIDLQNDYFPGGRMELVGAEAAVKKAAILLDNARAKQMEVIFLQHISMIPEAIFFLPDTDGIRLHNSLKPRAVEQVFQKHFPNSFRETGLDDYLRDHKITNLVIIGMMTHMCVDATVRAAFDKGFSCLVAHDSCATRDLTFNGQKIEAPAVHGSFMAALAARYAHVLSTEECLEIMINDN